MLNFFFFFFSIVLVWKTHLCSGRPPLQKPIGSLRSARVLANSSEVFSSGKNGDNWQRQAYTYCCDTLIDEMMRKKSDRFFSSNPFWDGDFISYAITANI